MSQQCSFRIHPDGFNGELPHLHEFARWKPCSEPVVVVMRHPYATHGNIPACEQHAKLFREDEE